MMRNILYLLSYFIGVNIRFCDFGAWILNCGLRVVSLLEMRVGDEMPACCFNMLKYLAL